MQSVFQSFLGFVFCISLGGAIVAQSAHAGSRQAQAVGPIKLALKYVVYRSSSGEPIMTKSEVESNLRGINQLWSQCQIHFQVEEFLSVKPHHFSLQLHPEDDSELTEIRHAFQDDQTLLVVTTGAWNRSGSLGLTGANAWTSMPGEFPLGSVLESSVGQFPNIIAHELGHYLNLDHVGDASALMNPVIYDYSATLNEDQCEEARATAYSYWKKMIRG